LRLVEVIVDRLDLGVIILALSLLECDRISESIDLILVLGLLLSEVVELESKIVSVLPECISPVSFG